MLQPRSAYVSHGNAWHRLRLSLPSDFLSSSSSFIIPSRKQGNACVSISSIQLPFIFVLHHSLKETRSRSHDCRCVHDSAGWCRILSIWQHHRYFWNRSHNCCQHPLQFTTSLTTRCPPTQTQACKRWYVDLWSTASC